MSSDSRTPSPSPRYSLHACSSENYYFLYPHMHNPENARMIFCGTYCSQIDLNAYISRQLAAVYNINENQVALWNENENVPDRVIKDIEFRRACIASAQIIEKMYNSQIEPESFRRAQKREQRGRRNKYKNKDGTFRNFPF